MSQSGRAKPGQPGGADPFTAGDELLTRAKSLAREITERVRRVAGDTRPDHQPPPARGHAGTPARPVGPAGTRFAASARHPNAIPNQHASYEECDTMHMYGARKTVLENREITPILKGEMSFATETS